MKKTFAILLLLLTVSLSGCGILKFANPGKNSPDETESTSGKPDTDTAPEKTGKPDDSSDDPAPADTEKTSGEDNDGADEDTDGKKPASDRPSLAARLCGKYSYHIGSEYEGEDEYLIMQVIAFGSNLYAFCGQAIADDDDSLESYSFWATEFIPDNAEDMKNPDAESVSVTALRFSIMSNAGKYWDPGFKGTITLTDDGLVFEGFDHDGFLVPDWDDSRLFLSDNRVEDTFCYLKDGEDIADPDIQGLWVLSGNPPVFYGFAGNNLYIYEKKPDSEVFYAAGGCGFNDGSFSCTASILGNGGMPCEWQVSYEIKGDELTLRMDEDPITGSPMKEELTLSRADASDIPVITMKDVVFHEDSFGMYAAQEDSLDLTLMEDGFFGIWCSAGKDRDPEIEKAKKLTGLGYDACVLYSPEWEGLNSKPYYCVTAGRFTDRQEAENALSAVKSAGYPDAYVKFTGKCRYTMINYTNFGDLEAEVYDDKVILKDVSFVVSQSYYPAYENSSPVMDLVIDKDAVFDDSCDMEFFGNYEDGDTPYSWYVRNLELMEKDPDGYMMYGPALSGVFETGIRGNRIERYFGAYWWD